MLRAISSRLARGLVSGINRARWRIIEGKYRVTSNHIGGAWAKVLSRPGATVTEKHLGRLGACHGRAEARPESERRGGEMLKLLI